MQGYYAAPRVKLACKQYACDAQTRDSRSGADARVVRCVFGVLVVCSCCPVTICEKGWPGRPWVGCVRRTVYCTLGRLEYVSSADGPCLWGRLDGLCGPWRRDGMPGLGRAVLRHETGVASGWLRGSLKCCFMLFRYYKCSLHIT